VAQIGVQVVGQGGGRRGSTGTGQVGLCLGDRQDLGIDACPVEQVEAFTDALPRQLRRGAGRQVRPSDQVQVPRGVVVGMYVDDHFWLSFHVAGRSARTA